MYLDLNIDVGLEILQKDVLPACSLCTNLLPTKPVAPVTDTVI